jgi:hypothetical protein
MLYGQGIAETGMDTRMCPFKVAPACDPQEVPLETDEDN